MMRLTARRVIAQERLETQSAVLGVLLGVAEQKKLKTGAVGYGQLTDFFLPNKPVSVTIVPVDYHVPGICELRISMMVYHDCCYSLPSCSPCVHHRVKTCSEQVVRRC